MAIHADVILDSVLFMASEAQATAWHANGGTTANIGQVFIFDSWAYIETAQNSGQYDIKEVTVNLAPDHLGLGGGIAYPGILNIESVGYWYFSEYSGFQVPYVSPGSLCYLLYMYPSNSPYPLYQLNYSPVGGTTQSLADMGFSSQYVIFNTNGLPYYKYNTDGVLMPVTKTGNNVVLSGTYYTNKGYLVTNTPFNGDSNTTKVLIPVDPSETYSYDDFRNTMESWIDNLNPSLDETLNIDDILPQTYAEYASETTEPTEPTGGCCCNCTVYVDADGNVTINNNGDAITNFNVDTDATLEANISAAAGAFGAGAIVIDADANVNLEALAGAFGAGAISVDADGSIIVNVAAGGFAAGAFGAGAIVNPEINISGEVSGSVSVGATDVNLNISGGDVSFQQSGTINNYYYYDPTEETQEPFTVDYDEIMSPSEFFDIMDYTNDWTDYPDTIPVDTVPLLPAETLPLSVVAVAAPVSDVVSQVISDSGLMPLLAPVSVISFYLHFLEK